MAKAKWNHPKCNLALLPAKHGLSPFHSPSQSPRERRVALLRMPGSADALGEILATSCLLLGPEKRQAACSLLLHLPVSDSSPGSPTVPLQKRELKSPVLQAPGGLQCHLSVL